MTVNKKRNQTFWFNTIISATLYTHVMCVLMDFVLRVDCQQTVMDSRDVDRKASWWLTDIIWLLSEEKAASEVVCFTLVS